MLSMLDGYSEAASGETLVGSNGMLWLRAISMSSHWELLSGVRVRRMGEGYVSRGSPREGGEIELLGRLRVGGNLGLGILAISS